MKNKPYQDFTQLALWKAGRNFNLLIFELVKTFPNDEKYRLTDQIIRSSRSINANIAEGQGRYHFQEQIQFCRQARGSLAETLNHLIDALDCKYITEHTFNEMKGTHDNILKMLNGYISYLKAQKMNN